MSHVQCSTSDDRYMRQPRPRAERVRGEAWDPAMVRVSSCEFCQQRCHFYLSSPELEFAGCTGTFFRARRVVRNLEIILRFLRNQKIDDCSMRFIFLQNIWTSTDGGFEKVEKYKPLKKRKFSELKMSFFEL